MKLTALSITALMLALAGPAVAASDCMTGMVNDADGDCVAAPEPTEEPVTQTITNADGDSEEVEVETTPEPDPPAPDPDDGSASVQAPD